MSNSHEWLTQEAFHEAAECCLAEEGVTLATITAYQVAKALGRSANPTIYKYFRVWKAQKLTEVGARSFALPAEMAGPLEHVLDRFKAEFMAVAIRTIGAAIHTLDEAANVKIAEAARARSEAETNAEALLDDWEKDSLALEEANQRIAEQAAELEECRNERLRLEGRLQQIMAQRERASRAEPDGSGR